MPTSNVTDEALLLESGDARRIRNPQARSRMTTSSTASTDSKLPLDTPNLRNDPPINPRFLQQQQHRAQPPMTKLSKHVVEEQIAEAYVSPARRKKATPKPPSLEPDLLYNDSESTAQPKARAVPSRLPVTSPQAPKPQPPGAITTQTRRPPLARNIPPISPSALQSSTSARLAGTSAFKRGDYAEATNHYTSALSFLPPKHPLAIVLNTNRALSNLKTGEPKATIADSTSALDLIGPSRGQSETIDLGSEGAKDMHQYWGKAMVRKAEAHEQLERWSDATTRPAKAPAPKKAPPKPSALSDLSGNTSSTPNTEAVTRLRAAHAAAEALDDEKFALSDQVSDRIAKWRSGKENNLRALLASLENVLWEGSGWKKVGMGELIVAGRVKVVYMKGIAKVHPDKVC